MSVAEVVERQPQSHPSSSTRSALARMGTIGRYDTVAWGLDESGEVTFVSAEPYLVVGSARVHVGAGFSGCLPVRALRLPTRTTQEPGCLLQIEPAGDQP
jgi:hypothetical protein